MGLFASRRARLDILGFLKLVSLGPRGFYISHEVGARLWVMTLIFVPGMVLFDIILSSLEVAPTYLRLNCRQAPSIAVLDPLCSVKKF